jgi:hypothetical protein
MGEDPGELAGVQGTQSTTVTPLCSWPSASWGQSLTPGPWAHSWSHMWKLSCREISLWSCVLNWTENAWGLIFLSKEIFFYSLSTDKWVPLWLRKDNWIQIVYNPRRIQQGDLRGPCYSRKSVHSGSTWSYVMKIRHKNVIPRGKSQVLKHFTCPTSLLWFSGAAFLQPNTQNIKLLDGRLRRILL